MNVFHRMLASALAMVATTATAFAQSVPLFGTVPFADAFAAISLDPALGQLVAQPFTITNPVFVGDISVPIYASASYDFRLQLVTKIGPNATGLPVADQSYIFDFSHPAGQYQLSWANLAVDQQLAANTYYIVLSSHAPLMANASPGVYGLGWAIAGPNGEIPGSAQIATISSILAAYSYATPPGWPPSFIDVENPPASLFVFIGEERQAFVAYSGTGGPFPPVPEPEIWVLMLAGLMVANVVSLAKRTFSRGGRER